MKSINEFFQVTLVRNSVIQAAMKGIFIYFCRSMNKLTRQTNDRQSDKIIKWTSKNMSNNDDLHVDWNIKCICGLIVRLQTRSLKGCILENASVYVKVIRPTLATICIQYACHMFSIMKFGSDEGIQIFRYNFRQVV